MWSYYGSKSKVVDFYPPPKYGKIIEPFAGSARYSLKFFDRDVLLMDKFEYIARLWKWLQLCSEKDILSLPEPKGGEDIRSYSFDCEEAQMLMRYMIGGGLSAPQWIVSSFRDEDDIKRYKKQIASQLFKIKHWRIVCGSYEELENEEATWFIDPPYFDGGHKYIESNKNIDYSKLAAWCKSRNGHIIVCENTKADWLPFKAMKDLSGVYQTTTEAIWSNFETAYDMQQLSLFGVSATNTA